MKWLVLSCVVLGLSVAFWRKRDQPWPCLVGKHQGVMVFGDGEVFLRCVNCQRRSEGWDLGGNRKELSAN